jgi:glycosyltransferase involved in cell wall biosynthesis
VKLIYAHDGYEFYDALFVESFRQKYDTQVITFHPDPWQIPNGTEIMKMPDLIPPISSYPFNGARKHILTLPRAVIFKKYVSESKADVIVASWGTTYGVYAAYTNHHPFVLLIWGSDVLILPNFAPLRALVKYALRKADIVVLDCDFQKKAAEKLGCQSSKILAFPWYDPNRLEADVKHKPEIRNELGFSADDIVVISVRKHDPIYGVGYLIEAIPLILRKEPTAKFLILGEGRLTSELRKRARKQIERGTVRFVGNVPHSDVVKYLGISDIYVSTSFSDGASASLLEAMTCSLPPVVTDIPANREWVFDGLNGYLVPAGNAADLAQKAIELIENETTRLEIGEKALETIRNRINWQRSMETLDETIMRCINRAPN